MSNIINIEAVRRLPEIYKKKVTPKNSTTTYTMVSVDFHIALDPAAIPDLDPDIDPNITDPAPAPIKYSNEDLFRSVVLNEEETRLLSFSLPKSIPLDQFKEMYKPLEMENPNWLATPRFVINEIIEGTMINLWWDESNGKWEISTKKSVSGNYSYSHNPLLETPKTFKEMFIDIVGNFEVFDETLALDKNYFYSFVLKHPVNHIVHNNTRPELYLVAVYEKVSDWEVKYIPLAVFKEWKTLPPETIVKYPASYGFDSFSLTSVVSTYEDIINIIDKKNQHTLKSTNDRMGRVGGLNTFHRSPFHQDERTNYTVGVMIMDLKTGNRTKVENEVYKYLKELRGNHPSYKYKYYELVYRNQLHEFIYYFPRYAELFTGFQKEFDTYIYNMYNYYVSKYILKTILPTENDKIPVQYRYHVNNLHYSIYLPSLKTERRRVINIQTVYEYIWSLPFKSVLFWVNYKEGGGRKKKMVQQEDEQQPDPAPPTPQAPPTPPTKDVQQPDVLDVQQPYTVNEDTTQQEGEIIN